MAKKQKVCYFCGSEEAAAVASMKMEFGLRAKRYSGKEENLSLDMSKVALKNDGKVVPCCPTCIQALLTSAFKGILDKAEQTNI